MKCWFNKFHPISAQCKKKGTWKYKGSSQLSDGSFLLDQSVWCDEHKHETDSPLKENTERNLEE